MFCVCMYIYIYIYNYIMVMLYIYSKHNIITCIYVLFVVVYDDMLMICDEVEVLTYMILDR